MIASKLSRMTARERWGLILSALFVAALLLDWMVVRPVLRASSRLAEDIRRTEIELANYRAVAAQRAAWEKEFERVSGVIRTAVSQSEEIAAVKGEVDELARKTTLAVSSMEHEAPRAWAHYDEYIVKIGKFEADRRAFLEFLEELQKTPGMLRVSRMSLTPAASPDRVKGSLHITKVMLAEGRAAAGGPTAKAEAPAGGPAPR